MLWASLLAKYGDKCAFRSLKMAASKIKRLNFQKIPQTQADKNPAFIISGR